MGIYAVFYDVFLTFKIKAMAYDNTTSHDYYLAQQEMERKYALPREILKKHGDWRDNPNGEIEILDAMNEYAKQEALSFAGWLANQVCDGRTITKLWADYRNELDLPIS
jgi:hypothetical protein